MKWFKHETDAHNNLKLEQVIAKFGMEGYGLYWVCVELVAKEGKDCRIEQKKGWFAHLVKNSMIQNKKNRDTA